MSEEKRHADSLSLVADEVRTCARCPLSIARTNAVPGEGPPDPAVVVIGEGPGRNEDLQGRPFVGAAGKQLDTLLKDAGLVREEVYITNVVKCRPPENRRPTETEAEACRPYLERQVELLRPTVVVLLGDSALKRFLPEQTLGGAHGRLFTRGGLSLFPTYHPAAMIYNRALEKVSSEDFKALGKVLAGLGPKLPPD
ncbi:MAG: uracil-DNA glycosylase [Nitrososphaerales archaeon]